jgi:outer membrane lipoprotein-sorting protein
MITSVLIAIASLALAPATQPTEPPAAEALFARHLEATGGIEAHRAAEAQRQTGTVVVPAMGVEGKLTILVAAPDRIKIHVEMPRVGEFNQGVNGQTGWSIDPLNGRRDLNEGERVNLKAGIDPQTLVDPLAGFDGSTVGDAPEAVENVPGEEGPVLAWRVDLTRDDGPDVSQWFALDTGLRIKRQVTWRGDFGDESRLTTYGDYRPVGDAGLLVPFKSNQQAVGAPVQIRVEQVELNPTLPANAFTAPQEEL